MSNQDSEVSKYLLPPACDDHEHRTNINLVRGALKLEASISTPVVSAGEEFSIYVVIRNPFSESVTVYRTETHIPIKLSDEIWRKQDVRKTRYLRREQLRQINDPFVELFNSFETEEKDQDKILDEILKEETLKTKDDQLQPIMSEGNEVKRYRKNSLYPDIPVLGGLLSAIASILLGIVLRLSFLVADLWMLFCPEPGPRVAVAVGPEESKARQVRSGDDLDDLLTGHSKFNLSFDTISGNIVVNKLSGRNNEVNLSADDLSGNLVFAQGSPNIGHNRNRDGNEKFGDNLLQELEKADAITLSPGDSLVKHFVLKTRGWLTFAPIAYTFQIQVRYMVNDQAHVDTVPFSLNIRAPMEASIIGSIIGSILGYIVSQQEIFNSMIINFEPQKLPNILLNLVRTVIFALIIIVAFARKSTVQQIVSVEDFWGGVFIGFLVGYSGDSFIQQFINSN